MPLIQLVTSVPANGTVENLLSGSAFEYVPRPALIELGCVALSGTIGQCVADISSGADILAENMPLQVRANGINVQDDVYMEDQANAGDRLKIRVRNTTGGAISVQHFVRMTYLA